MSPELGFFAIAHLITLILLTFQCRDLLKMQEKHGGGRFQFTLADCWAASLALIPGIGFLAWFINDLDRFKGGFSEKAAYVCAWAILIIGSQLGGIMLMVATNISPARSARNDKSSFGAILIGGLAGLFLPFVGLFFVFFNRQKKPKQQEALISYDEYVRTRKSNLIYTTIIMGILLLVLFGPDSLFWLILPIGYYFQTTNNKTKQRYIDAAERRKKQTAPIEEKQSSE